MPTDSETLNRIADELEDPNRDVPRAGLFFVAFSVALAVE